MEKKKSTPPARGQRLAAGLISLISRGVGEEVEGVGEEEGEVEEVEEVEEEDGD